MLFTKGKMVSTVVTPNKLRVEWWITDYDKAIHIWLHVKQSVWESRNPYSSDFDHIYGGVETHRVCDDPDEDFCIHENCQFVGGKRAQCDGSGLMFDDHVKPALKEMLTWEPGAEDKFIYESILPSLWDFYFGEEEKE